MNRTEALKRWRWIANGGTRKQITAEHSDYFEGVDLDQWIREVAATLLEADEEPNPARRIERIASVLGLAGKRDHYKALRELVDEMTMFGPVDEQGIEIPENRAAVIGRIVKVGRERRLLTGVYSYDDKKAKDLIRNIWAKKI